MKLLEEQKRPGEVGDLRLHLGGAGGLGPVQKSTTKFAFHKKGVSKCHKYFCVVHFFNLAATLLVPNYAARSFYIQWKTKN